MTAYIYTEPEFALPHPKSSHFGGLEQRQTDPSFLVLLCIYFARGLGATSAKWQVGEMELFIKRQLEQSIKFGGLFGHRESQ